MNIEKTHKPGTQIQINFDGTPDSLPPQDQFPLTIKELSRSVKNVLISDITSSNACLIVTGFTSLAQLIETFGPPRSTKADTYSVWCRASG